MTNEDLKLEAIKKAYGEYWGLVEGYTDQDGWLENEIYKFTFGQLHGLDTQYRSNTQFRPKSLAGIENNRGWIRIETEDDLPKTDIDCHFISGKYMYNGLWDNNLKSFFNGLDEKGDVSHYQPIIKPELPLW